MTRFGCSSISCISAGLVTNPIDVVKVRLQLDNELSGKKNIFEGRYYKGFVKGIKVIWYDEGFRGLSKGVGPSLLREGTYGMLRLGLYEYFKDILGATEACLPLQKKILAGALAGSIGSVFANPMDLVKIQMQGQGKLKPGEQPRHCNIFEAFRSICKQNGIRGLWRGAVPNVFRAAMVSGVQIPAYDHTKNKIKQHHWMEEGVFLHVVSSVIAGLFVSIATSPIDVIKTRTMNEWTQTKGKCSYSSVFSSLIKIQRSEGVLGFYKGFIPNWVRTGPHTFITFLVFEQLRRISGLDPV